MLGLLSPMGGGSICAQHAVDSFSLRPAVDVYIDMALCHTAKRYYSTTMFIMSATLRHKDGQRRDQTMCTTLNVRALWSPLGPTDERIPPVNADNDWTHVSESNEDHMVHLDSVRLILDALSQREHDRSSRDQFLTRIARGVDP